MKRYWNFAALLALTLGDGGMSVESEKIIHLILRYGKIYVFIMNQQEKERISSRDLMAEKAETAKIMNHATSDFKI